MGQTALVIWMDAVVLWAGSAAFVEFCKFLQNAYYNSYWTVAFYQV